MMKKITLGVIVGNRAFFPDKFVAEGRKEILDFLGRWGIEAVILDGAGNSAVGEVARQHDAGEEDNSTSALPEYSHPNLSQPTRRPIKVQAF